jgi:hypothetical protein
MAHGEQRWRLELPLDLFTEMEYFWYCKSLINMIDLGYWLKPAGLCIPLHGHAHAGTWRKSSTGWTGRE